MSSVRPGKGVMTAGEIVYTACLNSLAFAKATRYAGNSQLFQDHVRIHWLKNSLLWPKKLNRHTSHAILWVATVVLLDRTVGYDFCVIISTTFSSSHASTYEL